jgi:hypothetical protein
MAGLAWWKVHKWILAVIFNSSSDRCHNIASLPCLLGVGGALITSLFHSIDSPVYLVYGECLSAYTAFTRGFIL